MAVITEQLGAPDDPAPSVGRPPGGTDEAIVAGHDVEESRTSPTVPGTEQAS
ncbi:hypothetical protein HG717_33725 [Rhodococcus erythropolis]|uniref:hypothetical protein n=1 Tax=Rhodococcus erythropolis TaxID=1833 RepID=UPI001C9AF41B|nr:hypothetical protein [Rhodococcus erythropolis]MBY6388832.1 hypothetical protein [Rhodococcus erythropolis]